MQNQRESHRQRTNGKGSRDDALHARCPGGGNCSHKRTTQSDRREFAELLICAPTPEIRAALSLRLEIRSHRLCTALRQGVTIPQHHFADAQQLHETETETPAVIHASQAHSASKTQATGQVFFVRTFCKESRAAVAGGMDRTRAPPPFPRSHSNVHDIYTSMFRRWASSRLNAGRSEGSLQSGGFFRSVCRKVTFKIVLFVPTSVPVIGKPMKKLLYQESVLHCSVLRASASSSNGQPRPNPPPTVISNRRAQEKNRKRKNMKIKVKEK